MPQTPADSASGPLLGQLGAVPFHEQHADGYGHTLAEICQQPELWVATATQISGILEDLRPTLARAKGILLTGSGSSQYVGECIRYAVQEGTNLSTAVSPSGELILFGQRALPPDRPLLLVSFARSGNSPESSVLIRYLLESEPDILHVVLTCNRVGRVVQDWASPPKHDPRIRVITLDDRTCDRSLVMTSSFTNLAVAGLGLGFADQPSRYIANARLLANLGTDLLAHWADKLAEIAVGDFERMIVLGDGGCFGAGREAALKMLEMTDGRVLTMAETSLGFRHGPMCALHSDTMLVVFLSSDRLRMAYQMDLLEELNRKGLGGRRIVIGWQVPREVLSDRDLAIELPLLCELPDDWAAILHVVAGQLLAFFRCRAEGLQPDQPVANGAISRVVSEFPLHGVLAKVHL